MSNEQIKELNTLLRGERSAAETYVQALEKAGGDPQLDHLRNIKAEHLNAVQTIKDKIEAAGGEPSEDSGAWGTFAKTVMGSAKLFGDKAALMALKEGEEHGLKLYEDSLDAEIDPEFRTKITSHYIPNQRKHITSLKSMIDQIK